MKLNKSLLWAEAAHGNNKEKVLLMERSRGHCVRQRGEHDKTRSEKRIKNRIRMQGSQGKCGELGTS